MLRAAQVSTGYEVDLLFDTVPWSYGSQIGMRLDQLTKEYRQELSACAQAGSSELPRPRNYIIITDGRPSKSVSTTLSGSSSSQ